MGEHASGSANAGAPFAARALLPCVRMSIEEGKTPVERLLAGRRDDTQDTRRALPGRALRTQRSLESYLKAGVSPRWMTRLQEIESATRTERRRLRALQAHLREVHEGDPEGFAQRWHEVAHSRDFTAVNTLIRQHNDWFPIERDLPMDPRTGEYVPIHGRSYRRDELGPEWVLARFPPIL